MTTRHRVLSRTNGMLEVFMTDDNDPNMHVIKTVYDNAPVIKQATAIRELEAWGDKGEPMRHVAKIPQQVLDQAAREGWFNDQQKWTDWANDPANACFRTWPGKI